MRALFFAQLEKKTLKSLRTEVQKHVGVEENSFSLFVGCDFSHDTVINVTQIKFPTAPTIKRP